MKHIDFDTWKRKEHYNFFKKADYPQINICMNLDVTKFLEFVKSENISFYYAMIYAVTSVMNEFEEFRYKIRDGEIILHEELKPSFTDMTEGEELFKIVTTELQGDIISFAKETKILSEKQKEYFPEGRDYMDDLIYISCIPWISFTGVSNEIVLDKEDSIPRLSWGKYFNSEGKIMMPFSIQVNHMLIDGVNIGEYTNRLQDYLNSTLRPPIKQSL